MDTQYSSVIDRIAAELLQSEGLQLQSCKVIQSLWAGYGQICRVKACQMGSLESQTSPRTRSFILKHVRPPSLVKYCGLDKPNEGHIRKVLSYQIEQYFYTYLAPQMPRSIGVASCLSSINHAEGSTHITAMIMTDLKEEYVLAGERRVELSNEQTHAALKWLANFHGYWWTRVDELSDINFVPPPLDHFAAHRNIHLHEKAVWLNGGYTYLATRKTEYANLQADSDSEWSSLLCMPNHDTNASIAEMVACFLATVPKASSAQIQSTTSSQQYQTLIHGDVKSENMFISADSSSVAFYDFQYVGLGFGVCDLAKLFTCCVPLDSLLDGTEDVYVASELSMQKGEEKLLRRYLSQVRETSGRDYPWKLFLRHWETALVDWLRFQATWGFWGNTEWLEARTKSIIADRDWIEWLKNTSSADELHG